MCRWFISLITVLEFHKERDSITGPDLIFQKIIMNNEISQHNILKGYSMMLYFAGSMVMYEPSEDCFVDFWQNGIVKKLPVKSGNPNFVMASAQLNESCREQNLCERSMHEDYIRLFGRKDLPLAPPLESAYSEPICLTATSNPLRVSRFYESYGWVSKFRDQASDDHLGVELFFLTLLIEKYTELDDNACRSEMRKEIRRFLAKHLLSWVNDWNRRIQENARTLCYKGIGTLVVACLEDIYSLMESQVNMEASSPGLRN